MRRALMPSRSDTMLDTLMCASSSSASSRFWSCTRLRVTWYLRRITVRQSRCSASGTKLKVSSWATRRFTNRSASGKSFLRPPGPRFDCAWARWSVPASRGAPSRARRRGRQCCSRASHTGRQYCAVDSMTTSSTSCSTSQSARPTQIGRRRADLLALEVEVAVDLDVGHHDRQHLLVHVNSRDPVRHRSLLGRAESVPRRISQGRGLSSVPSGAQRRPIIRSITHAPDQTVARPRRLHWLTSISPLPALF